MSWTLRCYTNQVIYCFKTFATTLNSKYQECLVLILSSSCFFGKQSANRTSACCFTITALLVTVDFDKVWCQWLSICFIVTWNKKANYWKQTAHQWQTVSGKYYCDKYRVGQRKLYIFKTPCCCNCSSKNDTDVCPKMFSEFMKMKLMLQFSCSCEIFLENWLNLILIVPKNSTSDSFSWSCFFAIILKYIRQSQISPVIEDYLCTNQLKQVLTHVNYGVVSLVRLQHS